MGQVDETSGVLWAELLVDFVLRDWPKDQFHHAVPASQPAQLLMLMDQVEQIAAVSAKRAKESAGTSLQYCGTSVKLVSGANPVESKLDDKAPNPAEQVAVL